MEAVEWAMAYSDAEEWFFSQAMEGDQAAIKGLLSRPKIPAHLAFAWDSFWALSGDRPFTIGGIGPISFLAIDRYANRFGITEPEEFSVFFDLIRAIDGAYIRYVNGKGKSA